MRDFRIPVLVRSQQMDRKAIIAILTLGLAAIVVDEARAGQRAPNDIYAESCAVCHGVAGGGAMPGIPDLTEPKGGPSKPDGDLIRAIVDGIKRPGLATPMPPSGLDKETAKAVLVYLRAKAAQSR